ncbi:formylglycine-generating enzyme family protein [Myxococcota bacterium]
MKQGYRFLIVREPAGPVRELLCPLWLVWALGLAVPLGLAAVGMTAWLLSAIQLGSSSSNPAALPEVSHDLPDQAALLLAKPSDSSLVSDGCPPGMVLVVGDYCPKVFHRCLSQADPEGSALHGQRCAEYKSSPRCLSPQRTPLRYCIDRDEFVSPGESLPQNSRTFAQAQQACGKTGKRLCSESEWTFACEGEDLRAYPYGFVRQAGACNVDRTDLVSSDGVLRDRRALPGSHPECQSVFGVRDLSGNLEEYVVRDGTTDQPVRKGAYWQSGAHDCRASQPHPEATYSGVEVGFRCCADAA